MKKKNKNQSMIAFVFVLVVVFTAAVGGFYHFMHRDRTKEADKIPAREIDKLLAKDMEEGYPETPKAVLELYGRMTLCLYKNETTDEEVSKLLTQLRTMYAEELLGANPSEVHYHKILEERKDYKKAKRTILNYTLDSSNLKYKTIQGKECTVINLAFFTRESGDYKKSYQDFMLVKENDKWKILGFKMSKQESASENEVENNDGQ